MRPGFISSGCCVVAGIENISTLNKSVEAGSGRPRVLGVTTLSPGLIKSCLMDMLTTLFVQSVDNQLARPLVSWAGIAGVAHSRREGR